MGDMSVQGAGNLGERVSEVVKKRQLTNTAKMMGAGVGAAAGVLAGAVASMDNVAASPAGLALAGGLIGASLMLPNNETYKIKEGDTLTDIAKKVLGEKASPEEIQKFIQKTVDLNSDLIKNKDLIYKGDTIALPEKEIQTGKSEANVSFVEEDTKLATEKAQEKTDNKTPENTNNEKNNKLKKAISYGLGGVLLHDKVYDHLTADKTKKKDNILKTMSYALGGITFGEKIYNYLKSEDGQKTLETTKKVLPYVPLAITPFAPAVGLGAAGTYLGVKLAEKIKE